MHALIFPCSIFTRFWWIRGRIPVVSMATTGHGPESTHVQILYCFKEIINQAFNFIIQYWLVLHHAGWKAKHRVTPRPEKVPVLVRQRKQNVCNCGGIRRLWKSCGRGWIMTNYCKLRIFTTANASISKTNILLCQSLKQSMTSL